MIQLSPEEIIQQTQLGLQRPLEPEEQEQIELWHKGRALAHVTAFDGWGVAMEMLHSYKEDAIDRLLRLSPGTPEVMTAHAAASAIHQLVGYFTNDVRQAVEASKATPQALKRGLKSPVPHESLG